MKTVLAAFVITLLTISAGAQSDRSLTGSENSNRYESSYDPQKEEQKARNKRHKKMRDQKYENVLDSIPDSDENFDPWKNAR
jgi:hypothetical protein